MLTEDKFKFHRPITCIGFGRAGNGPTRVGSPQANISCVDTTVSQRLQAKVPSIYLGTSRGSVVTLRAAGIFQLHSS